MRAIHLEPERHEAPVCESYEDDSAVRRYEREVRVHRAFTESFTIKALEARIDGAYRVATVHHHDYFVDIVDGSRVHDACTCPDFLANELGTCMHVEVIRRVFDSRPSLRKAYARLDDAPAEPVLTVDAEAGLRLVAAGAWATDVRARYPRWLRSNPPLGADSATVTPGRSADGIRIVHAAPLALAVVQERARRASMRKTIDRAIEAGRVEPHVLRRPLFPYQRDGVLHLVRTTRGMLADDMGLGKTMQAIAACEVLRKRGEATPACRASRWSSRADTAPTPRRSWRSPSAARSARKSTSA